MTIYWVYKKSRPITLKEVINVFDLGYLPWYRKGFSCRTVIIHTYNRKQRNLELYAKEKEYNKNNSRKKILIEHTIISVDWKNIGYWQIY